MNSKNYDALVLKSINLKDSDKIYTLLVRGLGKISAKAKGVRKINSKRLSTLDTLNFIRVGLVGESEIRVITEVKMTYSFSNLKTNLDKLKTAYYFIEIVNKLIQESDEYDGVFELLIKCLKRLDEKTFYDSRVENYFEMNLLKILGYSIEVGSCVACFNSDFTTRDFSFDFDQGGIICSHCSNSLNYLHTATLNSFNYLDGKLPDQNLEFEEVDQILKFYIGSLLNEAPKSLKYLKL
jgi:DNA repair protein RecO (recombination protein O)